MLSIEEIKEIRWYRQSGAGITTCTGMPLLAFSKTFKELGLYFPNNIVVSLKNDNGYVFYHYFDYLLSLGEVQKIFKLLKKISIILINQETDFMRLVKKWRKLVYVY